MRRLCFAIPSVGLALLWTAAAGFAGQPQPSPQGQSQPQAQSQPQTQPQPQQQPSGAADTTQPAQTQDKPAEDQTMKGVKPGSSSDVNAIGNRDVGKGLNLYSL